MWNSFQVGTRIVDPVLSQISVGWPQAGFVGEALFPSVQVSDKSAKYYVFSDRSTPYTPENDYRAPGTQAHEIPGMALSSDSYYTMEHALQMSVTDEERSSIPPGSGINPEADATEFLTEKLATNRELAIKAIATTPGNYATGYSLALVDGAGTASPPSSTWSITDYAQANSDPGKVIEYVKRKVHRGGSPALNTAIIPYRVMSFLRWHPKLIAKFTNISTSNLSNEDVIATMGLTGFNVIVPEVMTNTAAVGQPGVMDYVWGDNVVLAYVPESPGQKTPAFGYQFTRFDLTVDRWREEVRRVDVVRTQWEYDLKLIGLDASSKVVTGFLITHTINTADVSA
jgi:hypothetical protein